MSRRQYDQACSIASALDRVGERWSMLIVRELLLGPLRFSDLADAVGGAPTDVLTRRLRDLEADGIVRRVELGPPSGASVYELTEIGREFEEPLFALGRWGLHFYGLGEVAEIGPHSLPGPLQLILRPPPDASLSLQLRSEGYPTWLRIEEGEMAAGRGELEDPDLTLSGPPAGVIGAVVLGGPAEDAIEVEGDREVLTQLREMIVLPDRLQAEVDAARAAVPSPAA
jgi:DNA-binding HxlR family transcriptional regulator